jgi:hypothetical protein
MSRSRPQNWIEFYQGPFDGHVEMAPVSASKLPPQLMCYVSENVFRLMHGLDQLPNHTVSSVAIYELRELANHTWIYQFSCACKPEEIQW